CQPAGFQGFKSALETDRNTAQSRTPKKIAEDQFKTSKPSQVLGKVQFVSVGANITLRSPQALLYYMGELMRTQLPERFVVADPGQRQVTLSAGPEPLLVVNEAPLDLAEKVAVRVTHRGETYAIPSGAAAGRSMQLLTLARHLFSLNIEEEDFRAPQTVRFLN
ncbi:MAG: hypothetical protein AAGF44_07990, partial [Pseudomonadota bacterium]